MDGLSAPSHYAAAFSSPSRTFAGRVSFRPAAANYVYFRLIVFATRRPSACFVKEGCSIVGQEQGDLLSIVLARHCADDRDKYRKHPCGRLDDSQCKRLLSLADTGCESSRRYLARCGE